MSTPSHISVPATPTSGHSHGPGEGCAGELGTPARRTGHGAQEERRADRRRLWLALVITAAIAGVEGVGGYVTNSMALMTDAVHMLTDVSAIGLSLLALWFGTRPANSRKTYGYYRLEILSALANGVLLLAVTAWLVVEALHRLSAPEPVVLGTMVKVAGFGLGANLLSLYFLHRSHSMNVRAAFLHILGDALSSFGVIVAGGLMFWRAHWLWLDPAVSLLISIVIVIGAFRLLRDAVDILLEAVPAHVDMPQVRQLMGKVQGVVAVHDLHVWTISSGIYALSAHLVVADPMVCNNDLILSAVKHELFERYGIDHTTIQIESETFSHLGEVH